MSPSGETAPRVAFVLNNIGDYHAARLVDCAARLRGAGFDLVAIEASPRSAFYAHGQRRARALLRRIEVLRLPAGGGVRRIASLWRALRRAAPRFLVTIGYSDALALATLAYGRLHRVPVHFLADSKADDQPRTARSERAKAAILRGFSGALVAGERHRAYFRSLGLRRPIEIGYDVIDNAFFRAQADRLDARSARGGCALDLPDRYVLCVSRLVDRKRVDRAIRVYAASGIAAAGVKLVIVGAGPNRPPLERLAAELGLTGAVRHINELRNTLMPLVYVRATALMLLSEYDQWGLCVNEAMALGVPCLVTPRCGVAGEIVRDGETGYVVDPGEPERAAALLAALVADPALRARLSRAAELTMRDWDLSRFSRGVVRLVTGDARCGPDAAAA